MSAPQPIHSRRQFIKTGGALALSTVLPAAGYSSQTGSAGSVSWGDGEVIVLSDGHLSIPANFAAPPDAGMEELHALLKAHNLPVDRSNPDCNITLWRTKDRLIMFDVGAGSNFMPSAGKLLEGLESAGIDPLDITDVVFTHAHPDHLWGVLDDFDELICPEAAYHMGSVEWDYWRSDNTMDKTPDNRKAFVAGAQNRFPYLEERISLFKAGDEILPGLEAVDTSGHTPGHMAFALHNDGQSLFVVGDALTNVALSFARPDWPSASDQDPDKGRETRLRLLDRMSQDNSLFVGFHLPHPGLGRVDVREQGYEFVPA